MHTHISQYARTHGYSVRNSIFVRQVWIQKDHTGCAQLHIYIHTYIHTKHDNKHKPSNETFIQYSTQVATLNQPGIIICYKYCLNNHNLFFFFKKVAGKWTEHKLIFDKIAKKLGVQVSIINNKYQYSKTSNNNIKPIHVYFHSATWRMVSCSCQRNIEGRRYSKSFWREIILCEVNVVGIYFLFRRASPYEALSIQCINYGQ